MTNYRSIMGRLSRISKTLQAAGRWIVGPHALPDDEGYVYKQFLPDGAARPHTIPEDDPRYPDADDRPETTDDGGASR